MHQSFITQIQNGIGGSVSINYKPYKGADNSTYDPNRLLPFSTWVVDSITQNSGFGQQTTTSYEYDKAFFDFNKREFRGFGYVKTIVGAASGRE